MSAAFSVSSSTKLLVFHNPSFLCERITCKPDSQLLALNHCPNVAIVNIQYSYSLLILFPLYTEGLCGEVTGTMRGVIMGTYWVSAICKGEPFMISDCSIENLIQRIQRRIKLTFRYRSHLDMQIDNTKA